MLVAVVGVAAAVLAPASAATATNLPLGAPILNSVQTSGTTVTLSWTDSSTDETSFTVHRAPLNEDPRLIGKVTSTTIENAGTTYTFTDTVAAGTRPRPRRCCSMSA